MLLSRRLTEHGPTWWIDGACLPSDWTLSHILGLPSREVFARLNDWRAGVDQIWECGGLEYMSPVEDSQEVWACGVTYLKSRQEREAESKSSEVYARVYSADRPEIFFKSIGWRTVGHQGSIRIRKDSDWNVPEPELTLVVNRFSEIVGYTIGNDVSSRSIEGENPLYLPQAKSYDGACAVGPAICLATEEQLRDLPIGISILRDGAEVFAGETRTSQMKRGFGELVEFLTRELSFPDGVFVMTGTGIVPGAGFTLLPGDEVHVQVGELRLSNEVAAHRA